MLLGMSKYGIMLAINVMLELAPPGEAGQVVSAWITCRGRTRVRLAKLYMYAYIYFYQSGAAWSIDVIGSGILDLHQAIHTHIRYVWRYDFIYACYALHSCHDTCLWLLIY